MPTLRIRGRDMSRQIIFTRQLKPLQDRLVLQAKGMPDTYISDLQNYLIYGLEPGSFLKSLYRNDMRSAVRTTDSFNQWDWIRAFIEFLEHNAPAEAWGTDKRVEKWLRLSNEERFEINYRCGLVLTEEETTMDILKEPV